MTAMVAADLTQVLIVEDDSGIATLERRRLERAGYGVVDATSAAAALARVAQGDIDLIVLDQSLPGGVSGLELYAQLRAAGHGMPVIMVTGSSSEATVIRALRLGVSDFVTKSLAYLDYLPEAVERALAQARIERQLEASERRFRATVEQAAVGLAHLGLDGRWQLVNERLCDIVGQHRATLLARAHQDLLHPDDRAAYDRATGRLLAEAVPTCALELRYLRGDGTAVWATLTLSLLRADDGAPRYFIAVIEDITARKDAEAERDALLRGERAARAQAQAAARAQQEFLVAASHELKTPLATIKGHAELLARRLQEVAPAPVRAAQSLGHLQGQIRRLESLVTDLLDLSRLQQGRAALRLAPVELGSLARKVIDRLAPAEELPRHALVLDAPTPVHGRWDAAQLERALANLVANALKYSPAGDEVRLRVGQCGEQAEVAVGDRGVGIPTAEHATIFAPFARGSTAPSVAEGTGLGLHLAATIVARHGGTIGVESAPGQGSTFTIRLPLHTPSAAEELDGETAWPATRASGGLG